MGTFIAILATATLAFILGFTIEASTLLSPSTTSNAQFSMWPLFTIVVITGAFGGFVHALENDETHEIRVPFAGKLADSGVWGHVFIGICGAFVAVAIMISIFGLDIGPLAIITDPPTESLKVIFYIIAIGIIGGYSGLPIISLISNAALKKVQRQVEALEDADAQKKQELEKVTDELESVSFNFKNMQNELSIKENELVEVTLKSVLLTAESHARNGAFQDAIKELLENYIPYKADEPKAYHWLALCEKRLGNNKEALNYVIKSLELKKSRLGYFNLACYKHLLDLPKQEVYDALHLAWAHTDSLIDKKRFIDGLQNDKDFTKLRESDSEYQKIVLMYVNELKSLEV